MDSSVVETVITNPVLAPQDIIALLGIAATVIIAIIGGLYKISTDTKKYELTENYRKELLEWYSAVATLMIRIIHYCESGRFYSPEFFEQKTELLAQLSALAEVGRFYFPNVDKGDKFGEEKPAAYRGYRHIVSEFILQFYYTAKDWEKNTDRLWKLERYFSSFLFEMVEPAKRNKEYSKYLTITLPNGKSIEDYIAENPNFVSDYLFGGG